MVFLYYQNEKKQQASSPYQPNRCELILKPILLFKGCLMHVQFSHPPNKYSTYWPCDQPTLLSTTTSQSKSDFTTVPRGATSAVPTSPPPQLQVRSSGRVRPRPRRKRRPTRPSGPRFRCPQASQLREVRTVERAR